MGLTLLDSSVLIAYLDRDDTLHEGAAEAIESALRSGSGLAISAVSWTEILNGAKQGHHDEDAIREVVADFGVEILPVTTVVAEQAARLQAGYAASGSRRRDKPRLRTPDALILATGEVFADVEQVLSGEPKWAKVPGLATPVSLVKQ
jgi:predicted nucleic acid-binding protein